MEELFDMIIAQMEAARFKHFIGMPIILTGGGAQLMGVREMAADMFGAKVRIGKPKFFAGLADSVSNTPFSSSVGMLYYIMSRPFEDGLLTNCTKTHSHTDFIQKTWQWLKKSF